MQQRKKQRRGQEELTPVQRRQFLRMVVGLFCLVFCWVLFAPGVGVLSLVHKRGELCRAEEQFAQLHADNEALRTEIEKINEDPAFLEKIVRERGFLGKGEMIFDFSGSASKN